MCRIYQPNDILPRGVLSYITSTPPSTNSAHNSTRICRSHQHINNTLCKNNDNKKNKKMRTLMHTQKLSAHLNSFLKLQLLLLSAFLSPPNIRSPALVVGLSFCTVPSSRPPLVLGRCLDLGLTSVLHRWGVCGLADSGDVDECG